MAKPGFFLKCTLDDFDATANLNYLGQAYTAHVNTILYTWFGPDTFLILLVASCFAYERLQHQGRKNRFCDIDAGINEFCWVCHVLA